MRLTKYTHACVTLDGGDGRLLLDPGIWSEPEAFEGVSEILVTHEHDDHVDVARVAAAVAAHPGLTVRGPAPVVSMLAEAGVTALCVEPGDELRAADLSVRVVGRTHAEIHDGKPGCANVGYVVEGGVYHPGDALFVPTEPVRVLLVPAAAPWLKLAEAIEFVRAVAPARAFPIHDATLNDRGEAGVDRWLGTAGGAEYSRLAPGTSVDV